MVLEARENAEEIWYSLVWEETKEASNVVDYNINPEITKDASSAVNANNDTTTGMANVIPWINAPKLIADTSIIEKWWSNIVDISDYTSIDERQPVVDRVLAWEWVCVRCIFSEYALLTKYYFIPVSINSARIRFQCDVHGDQQMKVNCNLSWTTITSITTGHSSA